MHYNKPTLIMPMVAGEDLLAKRLVIIGATDDAVIYPTGAEDTQLVGITLEDALSGQPISVAVAGFALCAVDGTANGGIAYGASIAAHSALGLGENATGGSAGNVECIGFAEEASAADGDVISIRIQKHLVYFAA